MNQNLKSEIPFFLKSVFLVILISGLLSVMVLSFIKGDATQVDTQLVSQTLGYHLYWIKAVAIMTTALLLQPQEDRRNLRKLVVNAIKITIYYVAVSLFFVGVQLLYIMVS